MLKLTVTDRICVWLGVAHDIATDYPGVLFMISFILSGLAIVIALAR